MKETIQGMKEFFAMLKEAIIVIIFLLLILWPTGLKTQLSKIGFDGLNFMGMSMSFKETAEAGKEVAAIQQQVSGLTSVIDSLSSKSSNPAEKQLLEKLSSNTKEIVVATKALDNKFKDQISNQQSTLPQNMIEQIPDIGWIYAGKLKENKTDKDASVTPTVMPLKGEYNNQEVLTVTDDVYLRNDGDALKHANADIITVLKTGEQVTYLAKDYSHSVGGGWFLWLKVKRNL
jgi:hypothetical protein